MESNDIFTLNEELNVGDENIKSVIEHHYRPDSGVSNINAQSDIHINVTNRGAYHLPADSVLTIEGSLVKMDGSRYTAEDSIVLINNAPLYLFSQIRYMLGGQEMEKLVNPGQATTMMGMLSYPSDYGDSVGLDQCWVKDNNKEFDDTNKGFKTRQSYLMSTNPTGMFQFHIHLNHLFGFCEDYEKIVSGLDHRLVLSRQYDNEAIFKLPTVARGKIVLTDIIWTMPEINPSDEMLTITNRYLNSQRVRYPIAYMRRSCESVGVQMNKSFYWNLGSQSISESPRWVVVAFQSDKDNNQDTNPAWFDNMDAVNVQVEINGKTYPESSSDMDFSQNKFGDVYKACGLFRRKFYQHDHIFTSLNISPLSFKNMYTLFPFDISKQQYDQRQRTSDLIIKAKFNTTPPPNTRAFALILSDKVVNIVGDNGSLRCVDDWVREYN